MRSDKIKMLLKNKINPSIKQLERKLYGLKIGTIQKALKTMKNPLSYTPMLTTIFYDISHHMALAMSLGLVVTEVWLDYIK